MIGKAENTTECSIRIQNEVTENLAREVTCIHMIKSLEYQNKSFELNFLGS